MKIQYFHKKLKDSIMTRRCIGIDIGSSHLRAVQLSQTDGQLYLEKVFSMQMRRSADTPSEMLKTLIKQQGFDRRADVAVSMPNDAVFFRSLESDFAKDEQTRGLNKFTLEHHFPMQPDEIIAQECSRRRLPDDKCSVLIAAVARTSLRKRLSLFAGTRMYPKLAEAAIFAVHSTIAVNHPEAKTGIAIIAYIDKSYLTLAVAEDNKILIVRNIPIISCYEDNIDAADEKLAELLSREAETTWRKVFGTEIEQNCKIYAATADGNFDSLKKIIEEKLNCQMVIVNPYAKINNPLEYKNDPAICIAEGLALRLLIPDKITGINFLEADNSNIKQTLNLKKEFVICVILAAAIAVVSLGGLFMRISHLEAKYARVKNEIREIFHRTLPEETNIVNPATQLEQKLEALRKDYQLFASFGPTRLSPLEVLRRITVNTSQQENVKIDNLFIAADSVRLSGYCDSFESVYQWQKLLQEIPEFAVVDVQDAQRQTKSGAVHFTMLISSVRHLAISEQK